jgi:cytoskeleton protein RodZ
MSDSDSSDNNKNQKVDFGRILAEARKKQNYTLEYISEHIKIPVPLLEALEASDLDRLPAMTFTQGYIRSYAKFLEISDEEILDRYNSTQPCREEDQGLKRCTSLPRQTTSQSPMIKTITGLLLVAGIAALIFGLINYYQQKADDMEARIDPSDSDIGSSLDSPSRKTLDLVRNNYEAGSNEASADSSSVSDSGDTETASQNSDDFEPADESADQSADQPEQAAEQAPENKMDVLEIDAEMGSWMEVKDANGKRLFYNMIPRHGTRTLTGKAPFKITMGNARTTKIKLNNIDIDLSDYISAKNTAIFTVSTQGQNIIFY